MFKLTFPLCLCAAAMAAAVGCDKPVQRTQPPPPKVTVSNPQVRQLVESDDYNGWIDATATVELRARVRGHIDKINFTDGQIVDKGVVLFELDPRPFQSDIGRAEDQVRVFQAQVVAAQKEEARLKELVKKGGASQSQVDKAEAETLSLTAQIDAGKQEIKRKQLDLEYAHIVSPMKGRVSRALLDVGNLVNAGGSDPLLTTIITVDPVYVYFYVDERSLQRYRKARGIQESGDLRKANLKFMFGLETDTGYPHEGMLDFADNKVDKTTGTILVRGSVKNDKGLFVPGMRVQIRLPISDAKPVTLVPDTALLSDQDKKYALVLDSKNVVQRRDVMPGKLLDDGMRIILPSGGAAGTELTPQDRIIVQGLQSARLNYPVEPVSAGSPASQPAK